MLTICENEMDKNPLRYLRCRLQFHKCHDLTKKSPCLHWAVELQLRSCSCRSCLHVSSSHSVNGKWLHWKGTAPLPQDMKVSSGRSQGLSWYAGRLCDPVTVHVTLALILSTEERAENLVTAEVIKIASSPKSWIDPELTVASQQVQQWLCVDHGSATLPKCHVRLHGPKSQKPNRYQKTLFLRGKLGSFYLSSAEETIPPAFQDGSLVGSRCQRHYFSGTPLGTVQHLSCSSAKGTPSTWPSAIHCCTAHTKQMLT